MGLLSPGGILVLAVPNPLRPTVIWRSILRQNYANRGHVCAWDRSHWMNFLENILQLNVLCYSQDYVPVPFLRKFSLFRPLEELIAQILPWFAYSNIAVIQKPGS